MQRDHRESTKQEGSGEANRGKCTCFRLKEGTGEALRKRDDSARDEVFITSTRKRLTNEPHKRHLPEKENRGGVADKTNNTTSPRSKEWGGGGESCAMGGQSGKAQQSAKETFTKEGRGFSNRPSGGRPVVA